MKKFNGIRDKLKLTSVKLEPTLYSSFKSELAKADNGFTLQKLTNRAIEFYLNDGEFRNKIENHEKLNEEFNTKKL